ncbi:MHC class I antigen [Sarotherodon galilaeus]
MRFSVRLCPPRDLLLISCIAVCFPSSDGALKEEHRAICPVTEIEAKEGDDVILQFHVDPPVNLSAFTMDWSRTNPSVVVYSYRHQQESHNAEMNATVRREDLNRGNLTLWIPSVQMSHSGKYTGFVMDLGIKCSVQLNVTKDKLKKQKGHDDLSTTGAPLNTTVEKVGPRGDMMLIIGIVLSCGVTLLLIVVVLGLLGKLKGFVRRCRGGTSHQMIPLKIKPSYEI